MLYSCLPEMADNLILKEQFNNKKQINEQGFINLAVKDVEKINGFYTRPGSMYEYHKCMEDAWL